MHADAPRVRPRSRSRGSAVSHVLPRVLRWPSKSAMRYLPRARLRLHPCARAGCVGVRSRAARANEKRVFDGAPQRWLQGSERAADRLVRRPPNDGIHGQATAGEGEGVGVRAGLACLRLRLSGEHGPLPRARRLYEPPRHCAPCSLICPFHTLHPSHPCQLCPFHLDARVRRGSPYVHRARFAPIYVYVENKICAHIWTCLEPKYVYVYPYSV